MEHDAALYGANDGLEALETVLVVDDSRAQRRLLAKSLRKWGYAVLEAESGEDALAICRMTPISLIVSDWMMPGMSGVDFCRAYRALGQDHPGYFVLLTAQTERSVLAEGLESGADDFLSKPVSTVELRARLRAGVRVLNAQRELAEKNNELGEILERLSAAYSAIDRDLEAAHRFQRSLVPDPFVQFGDVDLSLLYRPSGHVGGDMIGYFPVSDRKVGFYAVDVSGHGVGSALMAARVASYFSGTSPERNIALVRESDGFLMLPPDTVCRRLNELLLKDGDTELYLTMIIAELTLDSGEVRFCQAGHPSPILQGADGGVRLVEAHGMPVGLVDGAEYEAQTLALRPGERLLIYSDGLSECTSQDGRQLDDGGLASILQTLAGRSGLDAIDGLVSAVEAHIGGTAFPDDLSAILIERRVS